MRFPIIARPAPEESGGIWIEPDVAAQSGLSVVASPAGCRLASRSGSVAAALAAMAAQWIAPTLTGSI
jgi:hypothetical protein